MIKITLKTLITLMFLLFISPTNIFADFYQIWEEEKNSNSLNPISLDELKITDTEQHYSNFQHGFSFPFPKQWTIDKNKSSHYVRLYEKNFKIDIFYDKLKFITQEDFITQTIEAIAPSITKQEEMTLSNNIIVEVVHYKRPKLSNVINDLNFYSYYFIKNNNSVITFHLKTNEINYEQKQSEVLHLLSNLTITEPQLKDLNKSFVPNNQSPNIQIEEKNSTLSIGPNKVSYGLYITGLAGKISEIEKELDVHFGSQMFYKPISSHYDSYVEKVTNNGKVPIVTFHFEDLNNVENNNDIVQRIINGEYDEQITNWALETKKTGNPIFIRLGNEMNGKWVIWNQKNYFNDPDLFKLAYRHIVEIYKNNEVSNAYFVWNPNNVSNPRFSWNHAAMYYPSDNYVDWLGLTAYNFGGEIGKNNEFHYFDDLYEDLYKEYMRIFPNKPMLIGEFASVENNGNKPHFIRDMFEKIPQKYPNIKLVIWFNTEEGLPYDTTPESEQSFKEGLKHPNIIEYPIKNKIPKDLGIFPNTYIETTNSTFTFTGVAQNSNIDKILLEGEVQSFRWSSWKQFDKTFELKKGHNVFNMEVLFSDGNTKNYRFVVNKLSSFHFSTKVGRSISTAQITKNVEYLTLTGIVRDKNISKLTVNDVETPIKWSWRQFDQKIPINENMNEVIFKGFDTNGNQIVEEKIYLFKNEDFSVTSLKKAKIFNPNLSTTITGLTKDSDYKKVKVNGIEQILNWSWKQFDQPVELNYGYNDIRIDGIYRFLKNGTEYYYPIHKKFIIQSTSFDFLSPISHTPKAAPQINKSTELIRGLIKNKNINSLKINGQNVELIYEWKQFGHEIPLKPGLNKVVLEGYSDNNHQDKIIEEIIYFFHSGDLIITSIKEPQINFFKDNIMVTGMVPNRYISWVKINGIKQELKWSWKQFDQLVPVDKIGNNKIIVEAYYQNFENGIWYPYIIKKEFIVHKSSFTFDTPVSYSIENAPQTNEENWNFIGTIVDEEVGSLKINNQEILIDSNRKFDTFIKLNPGINGIKLKGYSDTNYEKELFEETVFIFNDKGFNIHTPETIVSDTNTKEVEFTGILAYSNYKSLKINGEDVELLYDWRQFSHNLTLPSGSNEVILEAKFEGSYNGKTYTYIPKKLYTVNVPENLSSYSFTTEIGYTVEEAPTTTDATVWIGALVKDGNIQSVSVNGENVEITHSWRQISVGVPLNVGSNEIKIIGYSDLNHSQPYNEEIFYYNRQ